MLFKPSNFQNIRHNNLNIHIDGLPIIEKKATKFLGVTIDSSLSWNDHIYVTYTYPYQEVKVFYIE